MIKPEALDRLIDRHAAVNAAMARPDNPTDEVVRLAKEYAELTPVVGAIDALRRCESEIAGLDALIADEADPDMRRLAEDERADLAERLPDLARRVQVMLLPKDEADEKNAILEVRAGTGGEEAALFAADLYRMYERYAAEQGWRVEPVSTSGPVSTRIDTSAWSGACSKATQAKKMLAAPTLRAASIAPWT